MFIRGNYLPTTLVTNSLNTSKTFDSLELHLSRKSVPNIVIVYFPQHLGFGVLHEKENGDCRARTTPENIPALSLVKLPEVPAQVENIKTGKFLDQASAQPTH